MTDRSDSTTFVAPLKNAIDFLHREWAYKPAGIVSYGGVAAGTRAAQMLKQVLTTLKMTPTFKRGRVRPRARPGRS